MTAPLIEKPQSYSHGWCGCGAAFPDAQHLCPRCDRLTDIRSTRAKYIDADFMAVARPLDPGAQQYRREAYAAWLAAVKEWARVWSGARG